MSKKKSNKKEPLDEKSTEQVDVDEVIEEVQPIVEDSEEQDFKESLIRMQAEFENYKKRTSKEREEFLKYASYDVVKELLPIIDNFQRAMDVETNEHNESFLEGFKMIGGQLEELLKKSGVTEIDALNQPFNPNQHQAIQFEETDDVEEDTVGEVYQKGYLLKDKIVRLAVVKVNKKKN